MDRRTLPAVSAVFAAAQGVLTVTGDAQDNTVAVSRDAAGAILVNKGAITFQGGTSTVADTRLIQIFGLDGNDNLSLNETNGALPSASIDGGAGNDTIAGGRGNDTLIGGAGPATTPSASTPTTPWAATRSTSRAAGSTHSTSRPPPPAP